jgi:hypothetical protein
MTKPPPTLAEQIDAVEWATQQAIDYDRGSSRRHPRLSRDQINALVRRLEAAAEQLRTWQFAQETLK